MEIPRHKRKRTEISMIPLINVVFLLLIFFLVAGTMITPQQNLVDIPDSAVAEEQKKPEMVVVLTQTGDVMVNNAVVTDKRFEAALTLYLKRNPEELVTVRADAKMPALRLVEVMRMIAASGGKNLILATETP